MTHMTSSRIAVFITGLTVIGTLLLILERGGLIAWVGFVVGIGLLAKIWFKPSNRDVTLGVVLLAVTGLVWIATHQYVISTWESGEVVELNFETSKGPHTARLWVMDIGDDEVVYFDAPPEAAESLLAGKPVQFERAGNVSTRTPSATPVDQLSEAEGEAVLGAMEAKYGDRNNAAIVYYALLGSPRDRIPLVARMLITGSGPSARSNLF